MLDIFTRRLPKHGLLVVAALLLVNCSKCRDSSQEPSPGEAGEPTSVEGDKMKPVSLKPDFESVFYPAGDDIVAVTRRQGATAESSWTGSVLFASSDRGDNWQRLAMLPNYSERVTQFVAAPQAWYALSSLSKIYRSSDRGQSWTVYAASPVGHPPVPNWPAPPAERWHDIDQRDGALYLVTANEVRKLDDQAEPVETWRLPKTPSANQPASGGEMLVELDLAPAGGTDLVLSNPFGLYALLPDRAAPDARHPPRPDTPGLTGILELARLDDKLFAAQPGRFFLGDPEADDWTPVFGERTDEGAKTEQQLDEGATRSIANIAAASKTMMLDVVATPWSPETLVFADHRGVWLADADVWRDGTSAPKLLWESPEDANLTVGSLHVSDDVIWAGFQRGRDAEAGLRITDKGRSVSLVELPSVSPDDLQ